MIRILSAILVLMVITGAPATAAPAASRPPSHSQQRARVRLDRLRLELAAVNRRLAVETDPQRRANLERMRDRIVAELSAPRERGRRRHQHPVGPKP